MAARKRASQLDLHPRTRNWISGTFVGLFVGLLVLSLLGSAGPAGQFIARVLVAGFGWGAWFIPLLGLIVVGIAFTSQRRFLSGSTIGGVLVFFGFLALLSVVSDAEAKRGGVVGSIFSWPIVKAFGDRGAFLIFSALGIIGAFVLFNYPAGRTAKAGEPVSASGFSPFVLFAGPFRLLSRFRSPGPSEPRIITPGVQADSSRAPAFRVRSVEKALPDVSSSPGSGVKERRGEPSMEPLPAGPYSSPPSDLLEPDRGSPRAGDIRANMGIIKRTFANFDIAVEMGEVTVGPTVTQYTLKPAEGVKVAQIKGLENDIALALAAHPIRIEAPIPGRSLVGIEVPNQSVTLVRLRSLFDEVAFRDAQYRLSLAVGRDVAGAATIAALEKMPHLLIAGATGTGKTIALNSLLISLLYRNSPSLLRLILIDPKRVEFPVYNGIPHLLTPVIVDIEKTIHALRWTVGEMERRFEVLSQARARDIGAYNRQLKRDEEPMPFIVVVIDELADIMASRGRDAEAAIVRLAQMARAVGIHLVVATQRPSVEVITGLIKANITTRMAFQVASQVDSRTILDTAGADKLLGNGDMLFVTAETSKPRRLQGAYVSEKEVKRVADFLRSDTSVQYEEGITEPKEGEEGEWFGEGNSFGVGDDPLYEDAKRLVIQVRKASASYLQRRLRVGYARAARLIDLLEERGVVGPGDGAKPREVLVGTDGKGSGEGWEE